MVRIYDDNLSGGTLEFKVSEPGTLRYQIDDTASYADAAAMDAAAGSAQITGSVAAPVGTGTEVIDTSGLAGGLWYIHLVQGATTDSAVVSVSFTKIANTVISVPAGVYTLTGYAPTITIDVANVPIDVDLGTYTLTGHGPNITIQRVITPAAGTYTLTGNAPIVTFNRGITVPAGSYTLTGYAPTITVGGGAFHPSDLFTTEEGAVFEISPSLCFTDTARTTAASVGDAVAGITDGSGNGNHVSISVVAERPTLRQEATGEYYLEFDQTDDVIVFPIEILDTEAWSQAHAYSMGGSNTIFLYRRGFNRWMLISQSGSTSTGLTNGTTQDALYVDGVLSTGTTRGDQFTTLNAGNVAIQNFTATENIIPSGESAEIGQGTFPGVAKLYAFVLRKGQFNSTERGNLETWLAGKHP